MTRLKFVAHVAILMAASGFVSVPMAFAATGPEIFKTNKCMECHSVKAAGIAKSEKKEEGAAKDEEEGDSKDEKKTPPDLSGVGLEREPSWMARYLEKKEKIDGAKHRKRFKGSKEELATLTEWLGTMKTKDAKK